MTEQQKQILDAYLKKLELALNPISVAERSDILLELHTHISKSLNQSQHSLEEILKNLGSPESVALGYLEKRGVLTSSAPSHYIPPPDLKNNNGCFKWGCISCSVLILIFMCLIFFLFRSLKHFATELQRGNGFNGQLVDVNPNDEKVNLLNGWLQVDGKNKNVKIGNLLNVDGKTDTFNILENVKIDGKKNRVIIQVSPSLKTIELNRDVIHKTFGANTILTTEIEFRANTDSWILTQTPDMSLSSYLDFSAGDVIHSINGQSVLTKTWTIKDLDQESTWLYTHNNKEMTLVLNLSDNYNNFNFKIQNQNP